MTSIGYPGLQGKHNTSYFYAHSILLRALTYRASVLHVLLHTKWSLDTPSYTLSGSRQSYFNCSRIDLSTLPSFSGRAETPGGWVLCLLLWPSLLFTPRLSVLSQREYSPHTAPWWLFYSFISFLSADCAWGQGLALTLGPAVLLGNSVTALKAQSESSKGISVCPSGLAVTWERFSKI